MYHTKTNRTLSLTPTQATMVHAMHQRNSPGRPLHLARQPPCPTRRTEKPTERHGTWALHSGMIRWHCIKVKRGGGDNNRRRVPG